MTLYQDRYRVETSRLAGWDYASTGWYFVTLCTHEFQPFFGVVTGGQIHLSPIGEIAHAYWLAIPQHTVGRVALDAFVVMPDHIHGIIVIVNDDPLDNGDNKVETLHCNAVETLQCNVSTRNPNNPMARISPTAGSLGAIVRSYKSAVSHWCKKNGHADFKWQARFYDRIIRDEGALRRIRQYIAENPMRWEKRRREPEEGWM